MLTPAHTGPRTPTGPPCCSWPRSTARFRTPGGRRARAGVTRGAEVERGLAFLLKSQQAPRAPLPDIHYYYGHYYAALATWAAGGDARKQWYPTARDELLGRQTPGGNWTDGISPHYAT